MYSNLVIRFTRDELAANDDVIRVSPKLVKEVDGNVYMEYEVAYTIGQSALSSKTVSKNTIYLTWDSFLSYIESMLRLTASDESPFQHVQFDLPMIPSIIVSQKNIISYTVLPQILSHIRNLRTTWPCTLPSSVNQPVKATHTFFDEDGNGMSYMR